MRTKWTYPRLVSFPSKYKKYFWDSQNHKIPLEKLIYRIFTYGKFEELRWLYQQYPDESVALLKKYKDIKRGVKFWIEYWHGKRI